MAKRRNLKKEKAERNLAYARRFRKNPSSGRYFRNNNQSGNQPKAEEDEPMDNQ
jgi:hypothetical protein